MHVIARGCVLFLWMYTLTFVKSQECTLQQFLNGPLYDTNFDTTDLEASYPGGKQIRVGCNIGYSGFFKLICVEGKWQSRGTKCQPRSCGHPGDAQFADFHLEKGDDFVFGSQVVYTCHKGYHMVSRINYRRCMAEGWDGVVPICEARQCPVIHVGSNVQVNGDAEEATYGNVVQFTCKSSSEILFGVSEIFCDENGEWSDEAPKCKAITCPVPQIENGFVPGDIQEYKENEFLYFDCKATYKRTEERPSKCIKVGLRAEWSPTPACEAITCKVLPAEGTTYEPAQSNVFSPGDTIRVSCGRKYYISEPQFTSVESSCQGNGEWTIRPVCKEVICNNQRETGVQRWDVYWGQQIKLDETATYSCKTGYKSRDPSNVARCTRYGWSPNPLCEEITCNRNDVENTEIVRNDKEIYRYNEKVSYMCKDGYRGSFTLTCKERGWSGRPQCTEITCPKEEYRNADIDGNIKYEYKYNDQVEYICKDGYHGRFTLTCGESGNWIGTPQCTRVQCKKLHIDNAYIMRNEKESYSHNDRVQYVCLNDGDRRFTVTCDQGVWTGIQSCLACPKAVVPHGFIVGPYKDTLYYTCEDGYKLSSKGWWGTAKCADDLWSGLGQCIEKRSCGDIPSIPNAQPVLHQNVHSHGQSILITCNEGYQAQVDSLTCEEGKWVSNGISPKTICTPIAKPCSPPAKVENAVILSSFEREYLSDTEVIFQCRDTYTMEGDNKIRCLDGKWEEKRIHCIPPSQDQ